MAYHDPLSRECQASKKASLDVLISAMKDDNGQEFKELMEELCLLLMNADVDGAIDVLCDDDGLNLYQLVSLASLGLMEAVTEKARRDATAAN